MAEEDKAKDDKIKSSERMNNMEPWRQPNVVAVVVVAAVFIFFLGAVFASHNMRRAVYGPGFGPRHGFNGGFNGQRRLKMNNDNRIRGVVTAVNDTSITVAGHGKSNQITINAQTQYSGATKAAVNDSVTIVGSTSNGTFTATRVIILP
jgi:hypothetical protein